MGSGVGSGTRLGVSLDVVRSDAGSCVSLKVVCLGVISGVGLGVDFDVFGLDIDVGIGVDSDVMGFAVDLGMGCDVVNSDMAPAWGWVWARTRAPALTPVRRFVLVCEPWNYCKVGLR